MKFSTRLGLAGLVCAVFATAAVAQDAAANFPSKNISMIVPYAAGGSSDTRARQIATKLAIILGKPVIVENKPGAAGNIGTDFIAKAAPDGHTIGIGNFAPLSVNKALFPRLPYDPARDLTPVVLIEKGPVVLLVPNNSPFRKFDDLVAFGKSNPGKVSYASAGPGGAFHLAGELLSEATQQEMLHVPYKGGAPATNDMLAGSVTFMFDMVPAALPYLKSEPPRARALGIANESRLPQLPNVPTFAELGVKDFNVSNWFGIVAPKATPPAVVEKLNAAINKALQEPDLRDRIQAQGNVLGGGSPEDFAKFVAGETKRWSEVIKRHNIRPE